MYRAKVISNRDPQKLGRLQVNCPQLHGEEIFSEWVYPAMPLYNGRGFYFVPKVGDIVWLLFENDDRRHPYYLPAHQLAKRHDIGAVQQRTEDQILLYYGDDIYLQIDEKKETLFIINKEGQSEIEVTSQAIELRQGQLTAIRLTPADVKIRHAQAEIEVSAAGTAIRNIGLSLNTAMNLLFSATQAIAMFLESFGLPPAISGLVINARAQFNAIIKP